MSAFLVLYAAGLSAEAGAALSTELGLEVKSGVLPSTRALAGGERWVDIQGVIATIRTLSDSTSQLEALLQPHVSQLPELNREIVVRWCLADAQRKWGFAPIDPQHVFEVLEFERCWVTLVSRNMNGFGILLDKWSGATFHRYYGELLGEPMLKGRV